jgi:hypothetical protein
VERPLSPFNSEHNLDVIKTADWIIDLGPEGGIGGGEIVVAGTPDPSIRGAHDHTSCFNHCRRRQQVGYCEANERPRSWRLCCALAYRSDAYRTVYAVKLGEDIWVVHAFQKKSTKGIKTPKREVDLIRSRISQLKEQLR